MQASAGTDLSGVAATAGPGLIGGVMAGLSTAKAIALVRGLPLVAVNHLEGHALSPRLAEDVPFPYLLLLVSGGHCQFVSVEGVGRYRRLGSTIDDAAGEAFDKTAKLLGLSGSGGPAVEREAEKGRADAVDLPRPLLDRPGLDMSFSGLKTAVRRAAEEEKLTEQRRADICASFQAAVAGYPRCEVGARDGAGDASARQRRTLSWSPAASPPTRRCVRGSRRRRGAPVSDLSRRRCAGAPTMPP